MYNEKLSDRIMYAYNMRGFAGYTADEVAEHLGMGLLSVRPTVTRLYQTGYLRRTGRSAVTTAASRPTCWYPPASLPVGNLPMVVPEREPLSLAEARRVGMAAGQITALRSILEANPLNAIITVKTAGSAASFSLGQLDTHAVLGLLIEREALFLASMGVDVGTLN